MRKILSRVLRGASVLALMGGIIAATPDVSEAASPLTLTATGTTPPVVLVLGNANGVGSRPDLRTTVPQFIPPSVLVLVNGTLTYSIDVTGDDVSAINAGTATWFPFDDMAALTASQNRAITSLITGIRGRVTAYTSGTFTMEVVQ